MARQRGRQTAPERPCACGCGAILPATGKNPPQRYAGRKCWTNSAAHGQVRRMTSRQMRQRNHDNNTCPCDECARIRDADRSALVAKVAAEMGVKVATGPAPKRTISAASLAKLAADRRAWYETHGYTASVA